MPPKLSVRERQRGMLTLTVDDPANSSEVNGHVAGGRDPGNSYRAAILLCMSVLSIVVACRAASPEGATEARGKRPEASGDRVLSPSPRASVRPSPRPTMTTPLPTTTPSPRRREPEQATPRPTGTAPLPAATDNAFAILTALPRTPALPPEALVPPRRLQIPKIDLDAPIYPVGHDERGIPIVLKHDVGWYEQSGKPGEGTNVVLWAHVLRWQDAPTIPAPFARVHELRIGDRITVSTVSGARFHYVVTYQLRLRPNQVEYLAPTPLERVVLVSCIGDNVIVEGELTKTHRLVTIAEPVQ